MLLLGGRGVVSESIYHRYCSVLPQTNAALGGKEVRRPEYPCRDNMHTCTHVRNIYCRMILVRMVPQVYMKHRQKSDPARLAAVLYTSNRQRGASSVPPGVRIFLLRMPRRAEEAQKNPDDRWLMLLPTLTYTKRGWKKRQNKGRVVEAILSLFLAPSASFTRKKHPCDSIPDTLLLRVWVCVCVLCQKSRFRFRFFRAERERERQGEARSADRISNRRDMCTLDDVLFWCYIGKYRCLELLLLSTTCKLAALLLSAEFSSSQPA